MVWKKIWKLKSLRWHLGDGHFESNNAVFGSGERRSKKVTASAVPSERNETLANENDGFVRRFVHQLCPLWQDEQILKRRLERAVQNGLK